MTTFKETQFNKLNTKQLYHSSLANISFSEEELRSGSRTSLSFEEEYFLLCEHLRQVQIMEGLENSSSTAIGTVVTYQNMYHSYISKLKDAQAVRNRIVELENKFEQHFDLPDVLEKGKELLTQRTLKSLQTKIEMLYFSALKKTSNISKLAGTILLQNA